MSKLTSESLGENRHTRRCTSTVSVVLRLRLCPAEGLQETEIIAALWSHDEAWEELIYTLSC